MDLAAFRHAFPITESRAYLFSGGLAPAATPVRAAMDAWIDRWMYEPLYHRARYFEAWEEVRSRLGTLFNVSAECIALTDNTSRASNLAVAIVDASPGANVVVDDTTYPSSLYPWLLPSRRVIEVRTVRGPAPRPEDVAALVDARTAAVSVSHVSAMTGYRHDLAALADVAHSRNALLIVDAAQSAGAVPIDLGAVPVDLLSGVSMKWLLGPPGIGVLYVAPHLLERLRPPQVGYVGTEAVVAGDAPGGDAPGGGGLRFAPGARRLEIGIGNLPGLAAFAAALQLIASVGVPSINERIETLVDASITGMAGRGMRLATPAAAPHRAGIIAAHLGAGEALAAFLRTRGVDTWGYPSGRIRVDPHGFNDEEDVARFLAGLDAFAAEHGRSALSA